MTCGVYTASAMSNAPSLATTLVPHPEEASFIIIGPLLIAATP